MTDKQCRLIWYIEAHGQTAHAIDSLNSKLEVTSYDQHGERYDETIPATWQAVRKWLGY